jgi:hypothetical protein
VLTCSSPTSPPTVAGRPVCRNDPTVLTVFAGRCLCATCSLGCSLDRPRCWCGVAGACQGTGTLPPEIRPRTEMVNDRWLRPLRLPDGCMQALRGATLDHLGNPVPRPSPHRLVLSPAGWPTVQPPALGRLPVCSSCDRGGAAFQGRYARVWFHELNVPKSGKQKPDRRRPLAGLAASRRKGREEKPTDASQQRAGTGCIPERRFSARLRREHPRWFTGYARVQPLPTALERRGVRVARPARVAPGRRGSSANNRLRMCVLL